MAFTFGMTVNVCMAYMMIYINISCDMFTSKVVWYIGQMEKWPALSQKSIFCFSWKVEENNLGHLSMSNFTWLYKSGFPFNFISFNPFIYFYSFSFSFSFSDLDVNLYLMSTEGHSSIKLKVLFLDWQASSNIRSSLNCVLWLKLSVI